MVDEDTGPIWGDCTNGRGGFRWEDGSYYEGEWEGGVMSGRGRITFADQNRFAGNFRKCQFHGRGTFTWADDGVFWRRVWRREFWRPSSCVCIFCLASITWRRS